MIFDITNATRNVTKTKQTWTKVKRGTVRLIRGHYDPFHSLHWVKRTKSQSLLTKCRWTMDLCISNFLSILNTMDYYPQPQRRPNPFLVSHRRCSRAWSPCGPWQATCISGRDCIASKINTIDYIQADWKNVLLQNVHQTTLILTFFLVVEASPE